MTLVAFLQQCLLPFVQNWLICWYPSEEGCTLLGVSSMCGWCHLLDGLFAICVPCSAFLLLFRNCCQCFIEGRVDFTTSFLVLYHFALLSPQCWWAPLQNTKSLLKVRKEIHGNVQGSCQILSLINKLLNTARKCLQGKLYFSQLQHLQCGRVLSSPKVIPATQTVWIQAFSFK